MYAFFPPPPKSPIFKPRKGSFQALLIRKRGETVGERRLGKEKKEHGHVLGGGGRLKGWVMGKGNGVLKCMFFNFGGEGGGKTDPKKYISFVSGQVVGFEFSGI